MYALWRSRRFMHKPQGPSRRSSSHLIFDQWLDPIKLAYNKPICQRFDNRTICCGGQDSLFLPQRWPKPLPVLIAPTHEGWPGWVDVSGLEYTGMVHQYVSRLGPLLPRTRRFFSQRWPKPSSVLIAPTHEGWPGWVDLDKYRDRPAEGRHQFQYSLGAS